MKFEAVKTNSIALKYFIRVKNIGDQINPILVKKILNKEVFWQSNAESSSHLMAIGSILSSATPKSYIWGSGLMFPNSKNLLINPENILALRGKKTREILSRNLNISDQIPLGDPGYIAPDILGYGAINKKDKKFRLGIVPHYVDYLNPLLQQLAKNNPDVKIIDVALTPKLFFDQMSDCEYIISSSLHGLIFAEALKIPNLWCEFSDQVAGNGFKFTDWYSLCENQLRKPVIIKTQVGFNNILELTKHCILGNPEISKDALIQSLLKINHEPFSYNKELIPVEECREKATPIFIISYNRGNYLQKVISSYRKQNTNIDIIIHDNGSDEKETKQTLSKLEKEGIEVYYSDKINNPDELNNVSKTISHYFQKWSEPQEYVVTDCDIDLSTTDSDGMRAFSYMLSKFRKIECVGPMLTISDIPETYSLKNKVLNRHISQFWQKIPIQLQDNSRNIHYIFAPIDTTFALYRAGTEFKRLKNGIRMYSPYEAKHLDWYITNQEASLNYSKTSSNNISHWNNKKQTIKEKHSPLLRRSFYIIEKINDEYSRKKIVIQSLSKWLISISKKYLTMQ